MEHKTIAVIIILFAAVLLIVGGLMAATSNGGLITAGNGQRVTCNVKVGLSPNLPVPVIGGVLSGLSSHLQFFDVACTTAPNPCVSNPFKALTIGDVNGNVQLLQSGIVYDSHSTTQNRVLVLAAPQPYQLNACVPKGTKQISLQIKNDQGGVDDERTITLQ